MTLNCLGGRGTEIQLRVQICCIPCSLVKAASLYVMVNLGHSCYLDCIEQALQEESLVSSSLESTRVESLVCGALDAVDGMWGLSALVSVGVMQWIGCTV